MQSHRQNAPPGQFRSAKLRNVRLRQEMQDYQKGVGCHQTCNEVELARLMSLAY